MKRRDRYDVAGLEEALSEPGSRGRVLKNRLGIKSKREMDRIEGREQVRALEELTAFYDKDHRFSSIGSRGGNGSSISLQCVQGWTTTTGRWRRCSAP